MIAPRYDTRLDAGEHIAGAGADHCGPDTSGDGPQRIRGRRGRAAIVGDNGRAGQQARDLEVPHHPAGTGVPEEGVVAADIGLQANRFEMLQEYSSVPVHNSLGLAGGAGGVQHPEWVLEIDRNGRYFSRVLDGLQAVPGDDIRQRPAHTGNQHRRDQARKSGPQRLDIGGLIVQLAAETVAVGGDQDLRRQLAQAIEGGLRGIVLTTGTPDGAETRGGQEGDHGLRNVREISGDPITGTDAQSTQGIRESHCGTDEFGPGDLVDAAVLVDAEDGGPVGAGVAGNLVHIVQLDGRKPLRAGHLGRVEHVTGPLAQVEIIPERTPEARQIVHGPLPQRRVVRYGLPVRLATNSAKSVIRAPAISASVGTHCGSTALPPTTRIRCCRRSAPASRSARHAG